SPLPDQGGTQRSLLRDLSDAATTRLGPPDASWPVLAGGSRAVLQLRLGHGDNLEVHPLARADSLAECLLGSTCPGPGGQGAMSLGMAVLPEGQDGQDLLPAHESKSLGIRWAGSPTGTMLTGRRWRSKRS